MTTRRAALAIIALAALPLIATAKGRSGSTRRGGSSGKGSHYSGGKKTKPKRK